MQRAKPGERPPIDIVFCVDGSGSMGGDNMDSAKKIMKGVVDGFKQDATRPDVRVGLIEYGDRDDNYKTLPLTSDTQKAINSLESIDADMGTEEWVGRVVQLATDDMKWRQSADAFRVVYVLGNETAEQGEIDYHDSVPDAVEKGVIVNAVQCEPVDQFVVSGSGDTWQNIAGLGKGDYFHYTIDDRTPFDLNSAAYLNHQTQQQRLQYLKTERISEWFLAQQSLAVDLAATTYIPYGEKAAYLGSYQLMRSIDKKLGASPSAGDYERKIASLMSDKSDWELVDASQNPQFDLGSIPDSNFDFEMRALTESQKLAFVQEKRQQREALLGKFGQLQQLKLITLKGQSQ